MADKRSKPKQIMKRLSLFKWARRPGAILALSAAALYGASVFCAVAADTKADKPAKVEKKAKKAKKASKLTGAELYSINCNRCHPERYATEFTASQWKTLMTHMRVRANLPASQAKKILKYLQEDSGS